MTIDTRPDIPLGRTYDAAGRALTHKNKNGGWYEYTYDAQGRELTYKRSDNYWYEYTYDARGNELTYKNSTGLWTTLAIDPDYTLRHNAITGIYWAGCRRFTVEQALDHWPVRDDVRAMQFTAAIINQLRETE